MGFPAVSIRTSTERPEAIDYGSIILGNIDEESIIQSVQMVISSQKKIKSQIPFEYRAGEVSSRIIRVIQSYTSVVNKEIWKR